MTVLASLFTLPSFGLVKFNDGRDEIFVTGMLGVVYDSNIFAFSGGDGDIFYTSSVLGEYRRKAGMLGVNASLRCDLATFSEYSNEDYANPALRAELTKNSGRTTGSITAGVAKETRADSAINLRTTSWHYDAGLNFKYPVIERYSLSGQVGYDQERFEDNLGLVDIHSYLASTDVFYVYTSQRDIFGGYRYRLTETSADTRSHDHAFTLGITGRIIPKLNGTIRGGYQIRQTERVTGRRDTFGSFTALASTTWTVTRRISVTGQLSRDFNTLATDTSVETTAGGLDAQFAMNAKVSLAAGIGGGHTRFLDEAADRRDTYGTYNVGVSYTMNDHLKVSLTYLYFENWSSFWFSDYRRHSVSLNVSSRW